MSQQQSIIKQRSRKPIKTYPLDVEGAIFAWSMHRLSRTYSGPVIRIRVLDANAFEYDIGLDGDALDESAIDAVRGSADVGLVQYFDQSGNSLHSDIASDNASGRLVIGNVWQRLNGKAANRTASISFYTCNPGFSGYGSGYYWGNIVGTNDAMLASDNTSNGNFDALADVGSNSDGYRPDTGIQTIRANGITLADNLTRDAIYQALTGRHFIYGIANYNYGSWPGYRLGGRFVPWAGLQQGAIVWSGDKTDDCLAIETAINSFIGAY